MLRHLAIILAAVFLGSVTAAGISTFDATTKAEAASGGYVKRCGGGKIFLNAKERRSFYLHNKARKNRGIKPLCVHPKLQKIARAHSKDMIRRDYFSHYTKGSGLSPQRRAKRAGYNYRYFGENIAYGQGPRGSADAIFKLWMNSSSHRSNILSRKFREVGIGAYTGTYKGYKNVTMWTADFGTRL